VASCRLVASRKAVQELAGIRINPTESLFLDMPALSATEGMEHSHRRSGWICLARRDLREPLGHCLQHHRHGLERPAAQTSEVPVTARPGHSYSVKAPIVN